MNPPEEKGSIDDAPSDLSAGVCSTKKVRRKIKVVERFGWSGPATTDSFGVGPSPRLLRALAEVAAQTRFDVLEKRQLVSL